MMEKTKPFDTTPEHDNVENEVINNKDAVDSKSGIFREFTEEIDVLGLKFIGRPGIHTCRKVMYLLLVLFGIGFAIAQIHDQVSRVDI